MTEQLTGPAMKGFTPPPESEVQEILSEPIEMTGGEPDGLLAQTLALEWLEEGNDN